jgi:hypothetical protein
MYVTAVNFLHGDVVMKRDVARGTPHLIYPVRVVEDAGDRLTVFLASGTPLVSPEGAGRGRTGTHGKHMAAGRAMGSFRY